MKESNGEYWYDVGDEKARDKTSQALRENSMSVRRQMEEEFNETRRQQAIAAGRDPVSKINEDLSFANLLMCYLTYLVSALFNSTLRQNQSTEEISSKPHVEPPTSGGKFALIK